MPIASADSTLGPVRIVLDEGCLVRVDFDATDQCDAEAAPVAEQVAALIDHGHEPSDLPPLRLHGTAFRQRVWEALRATHRGDRLTYGQLAERIGQPRATRAVASACGANPVAIVVPCHRIMRTDGGLGGFRWGLHRKRHLLEAETSGLLPMS